MSEKDFELLIKMLGQTTHDNDNQKLVALRKANDLATKLGGWEALLRGKVKITVLADPFDSMNIPPQATPAHRNPTSPSPPPPNYGRAPHVDPYSPPPSASNGSSPHPKAQTPRKPTPPPRPNKFEGTCTTCNQKVAVGDGIAYMSGSRWHTRHKPGDCPPTKPRQRKAFTSDDLQI